VPLVQANKVFDLQLKPLIVQLSSSQQKELYMLLLKSLADKNLALYLSHVFGKLLDEHIMFESSQAQKVKDTNSKNKLTNSNSHPAKPAALSSLKSIFGTFSK